MNSIFDNPKLGVPVEQLRLREVGQQIESQRFGNQLTRTASNLNTQTIRSRWLKRTIPLRPLFALLTQLLQ